MYVGVLLVKMKYTPPPLAPNRGGGNLAPKQFHVLCAQFVKCDNMERNSLYLYSGGVRSANATTYISVRLRCHIARNAEILAPWCSFKGDEKKKKKKKKSGVLLLALPSVGLFIPHRFPQLHWRPRPHCFPSRARHTEPR